MGMPVVTVAAGGMPVVDTLGGLGTPVSEASNGYGRAVTKVSNGLGLPVAYEGGGAAPTYDADTNAWAAQVVARGGTVSAASKALVDGLVTSIKAHPTFGPDISPYFDRILLLANKDNSLVQSMTSLANPSAPAGIPHGTITRTVAGWAGDGTTGYIDTGFNPSGGSDNYQTGNAFFSLYADTLSTADFQMVCGATDGTNSTQIIAYRNPDAGGCNINSASFGGVHYGSNLRGLHIFDRPNNNHENWVMCTAEGIVANDYLNNASLTPNLNLYLLARNNAGVADAFNAQRLSFWAVGASFTTAEHTAMAGYIKTYLTGCGLTVPY